MKYILHIYCLCNDLNTKLDHIVLGKTKMMKQNYIIISMFSPSKLIVNFNMKNVNPNFHFM